MENCRICNSKMKIFLNLGKQPIANNFLATVTPEKFYSLEVAYCPNCHTVQLVNCIDPIEMFNDNYAFYTSTSSYMSNHFKKLSQIIKKKYLTKDGFIVELGSNDGTFLKNFSHMQHLGIEPSDNVAIRAIEDYNLNVWIKFFDEEIVEEVIEQKGKADVVVTTNVFPHIQGRNSVLKGIKTLLNCNGVWINEEAYLGDIINNISYDQFYNEHVFYSSVGSFNKVLAMFDLKIIDVEFYNVHGGSVRYFVSHIDAVKNNKNKINNIIKKEDLFSFESFDSFAASVENSKYKLLQNLYDLKAKKKSVVGYAATAKSTTVLNYCDIGISLIEKIYDTTPLKQGKYSPGKHIPIVSYDNFKEDNQKNVVLFAQNHSTEIYEKERGKNINWILPI